jgi:flagellar biosynthetic protein FliQ
MTELEVVDLAMEAMWTGALIAGPILVAVLIVGVVVGIFQAATSINEMTLSFLPKLVVVTLLIALLVSWLLQFLVDFTRRVFQRIPELGG